MFIPQRKNKFLHSLRKQIANNVLQKRNARYRRHAFGKIGHGTTKSCTQTSGEYDGFADHELLSEVFFFNELTDDMPHGDMTFLDAGRIVRWNIDEIIAKRFHFSSCIASETYSDHFFFHAPLQML